MVFNYKKLLELHKQSGEKSIDFLARFSVRNHLLARLILKEKQR